MPSIIANAIGTQKQFMPQQKEPYQKSLQENSFGSGISEGHDYNAPALANALGALGETLVKNDVDEDRRKREQYTTEEAERAIVGQTPEDLAKFDRMQALQHSDKGYDLTDNPYAMAILEKSIGQVAAVNTKQNYLASLTTAPKTVADAIKGYQDAANETYEKYKDSVKNKAAFDDGFYKTFLTDTATIATDVRKRIATEARQTGQRVIGVKFDTLLENAPSMQPEQFKKSFSMITREAQSYFTNAKEAADFTEKVLTKMADTASDTYSINALRDVKFFGEHTIGDEISYNEYYKKIAKKATRLTTEELIAQHTHSDGTINLSAVKQILQDKYLNPEGSKGTQVNTFTALQKVTSDTLGDAYVFGTDGANNTWDCGLWTQTMFQEVGIYLKSRAVDYQYKQLEEEGKTFSDASQLKPGDMVFWKNTSSQADDAYNRITHAGIYIGDGKVRQAGTHGVADTDLNSMEVAGYGRTSSNTVDGTASAYAPDRFDEAWAAVKAADADARRKNRQMDADKKKAAIEAAYGAESLTEAIKGIETSGLSISQQKILKDTMVSRYNKLEKAEKGLLSEDEKWALKYEGREGKLKQDTMIYEQYIDRYKDGNLTDSEERTLQLAMRRLDDYFHISHGKKLGTPYDDKPTEKSDTQLTVDYMINERIPKEQIIDELADYCIDNDLDFDEELQKIEWGDY